VTSAHAYIRKHQARTNANDKISVKDYIFVQNIMHTEKYSNVDCTETEKGAKWCQILLTNLNYYLDLLLEVVDLK